MSKIKKSICKFINTKIFPESIMEIKNDCYNEEKQRVANEFNKLENSYRNLKNEFTNLANHKFIESVNVELQKSKERQQEKVAENQYDKSKEKENPFDDWR